MLAKLRELAERYHREHPGVANPPASARDWTCAKSLTFPALISTICCM
jgi:hypothetical protein